MSDLHEAFEGYLSDLFVTEDAALKTIYDSPQQHDMPMISVTAIDGYLLQWLMRLIGAKKVVEIGALAGYSGTWIARALPVDGKLYSLEKSSKHAALSRENFQLAGVADKIQLLEGDSHNSLKKLSAQAPFDMVFIDADKSSYPDYLKWAVENLRVGGMVAAHNAYRHGKILTPESDDDRAMDVFNRALAAEPRLDSMIIPLGDAMAVGVKKQ